MRIAIAGLPQSGRTTVWKALSRGHIGHEHVSVVKLPDERLHSIAEVVKSVKTTPMEIELMDTIGDIDKHGIVFSDLQGADGIIFVLRAFDAGFGEPNPLSDAEKIRDTIILFDARSVETRMKSRETYIQEGYHKEQRPQMESELLSLKKIAHSLDRNEFVRFRNLSELEQKLARNQGLISMKNWLVILNIEENADAAIADKVAKILDAPVISLAGQLELELSELSPDEEKLFRQEMGIPDNAVENVLTTLMKSMELIEFYTANNREARAWAIRKGTIAIDAAAKIHTDMARGFIRAEVINWKTFVEAGGYHEAKSKSLFRIEGKEYIVQDGDVIQFRFNV